MHDQSWGAKTEKKKKKQSVSKVFPQTKNPTGGQLSKGCNHRQ